MKNDILSLFLIMVVSFSGIQAQKLDDKQIYLADPTIFVDNGTYYLYGTKNDPRIKGEGFLVYTSKDLKNWEEPKGLKSGYALKKGDAFGTKGFWAPQVFKHKEKYYMAYTANEHIAIATSDSPLGPFKNEMEALKAPVKQIDPYVFFDNGKIYLYHVRLQEGNRIFVAEIDKDLKSIKPETLKECIHAEDGWENTADSKWPVSEGPTVFKKDNFYYMLYSANDFRNQDYAVGCAISQSPFGPWKKVNQNPVLSQKSLHQPGTGHGDLFYGINGGLYYVLHTHYSKDSVRPRKTALAKIGITSKEENFTMKVSDFSFIKVKE